MGTEANKIRRSGLHIAANWGFKQGPIGVYKRIEELEENKICLQAHSKKLRTQIEYTDGLLEQAQTALDNARLDKIHRSRSPTPSLSEELKSTGIPSIVVHSLQEETTVEEAEEILEEPHGNVNMVSSTTPCSFVRHDIGPLCPGGGNRQQGCQYKGVTIQAMGKPSQNNGTIRDNRPGTRSEVRLGSWCASNAINQGTGPGM
ncbi:hypothetical protein EVAR_102535_1 [Eumeta japonica]|uniref:Uncharacterized protein n=1 Tax=Eumeta variegata TaxID=151549 RepID=A0A4C1TQE4_EUMVA|nr:hypothetical protein EVAR_102535_1 [Eumeta japonica]